MDAVYDRPFLSKAKIPIAIGGYFEANTFYSATDGISEGFSFQFRRLSLFLSSSIAKRIKFLAEIEFEDGTKEINIEYASIDLEFHPLLNLRGGIILNPIGSFNQNHDGPKWDFIDRPISSTHIIPSTLSNVGFGLHGKLFKNHFILGYEAYLSNGFDDRIIDNTRNRTSLSEGKMNPEKFEESNSGLPMYSGKIALKHRKIGELGLSFLSGVYNKWQDDGLILDRQRYASIAAIDFSTDVFKNRIQLQTELAKTFIDVPNTYTQNYGSEQVGGFLDIIVRILNRKMLGWENAKLNVGARLEYVDYNTDTFRETGLSIGDELWSVVPCISFRPSGSTVLRFNYRFMQEKDLLNNPATKTGAFLFGFSCYF